MRYDGSQDGPDPAHAARPPEQIAAESSTGRVAWKLALLKRLRWDGRPSLVINALSSWAGFAVTVVVGFLLTPFIISRLGKSGYGVWCLVGSVVGYYGLLDLGVSAAVRRYVARYAAKKDYEALNETVSAAVMVFAVAGLIMIGVSLLAGRPLARFFKLSDQAADQFYVVIILLGLSAGVNIVGQVFRATIAGHERFVIRNCVIMFITAVRAALTVWALLAGWGLVGVAGAYMVVDVVALVVYMRLVKRLTPHVRIQLGLWRRRRARRLFTYGLTMTVIVGAGIVQAHTASAVLAKVVSLEAVAIYAVAGLLIRHFSNLIHAGMGVLGPRFAALQGVNDLANLRRLVVKGLWASTMLSCAAGLAMLILGPRFLELWVGGRFSPAELQTAVTVLMLLAVGYTVGLSQDPGATVLYAMNRHRPYAWIMVAEAVGSLVLSIVLARRIGAVGVAMGAMISIVAIRSLAQPVYVSKVVGLSLRQYCVPVIVPTVVAVGVWWLWRMVLWPHVPTVGYGGLMVAGVCVMLTYAGALTALQAASDIARGRPLRLAIPFVSRVRSYSVGETGQ